MTGASIRHANHIKGTIVTASRYLFSVPTGTLKTKRASDGMLGRYQVGLITAIAVFMLGAALWVRSGPEAAVVRVNPCASREPDSRAWLVRLSSTMRMPWDVPFITQSGGRSDSRRKEYRQTSSRTVGRAPSRRTARW